MPSESAKPPRYDARMIEVLSFAEAVRKRPHMYFGPNDRGSDLAITVVRVVAADALGMAEDGLPAEAQVVIHSDTRFTICDNIPLPGNDDVECRYRTLDNISGRRWALAACAAVTSRAVVEVSARGRSWRQEFAAGTARYARMEEHRSDDRGTRAAFELDAGYFKPGTAIPRDATELRPTTRLEWNRRDELLPGTLIIIDLRA